MPDERKSLGSRLKHAFAVDPAGPAEPSEEQRRLVDRLCGQITRRRLTTPALLFLEMSRPLNYVGAQVMHFLQPFFGAIFSTVEYRRLAAFLEARGSIEYICRRLQELEEEDRKRRSPPTTAGEEVDARRDSLSDASGRMEDGPAGGAAEGVNGNAETKQP
ncbi:MAG: hypothetical protein ACE5GW_03480 [Planctomycetota bacterium]